MVGWFSDQGKSAFTAVLLPMMAGNFPLTRQDQPFGNNVDPTKEVISC